MKRDPGFASGGWLNTDVMNWRRCSCGVPCFDRAFVHAAGGGLPGTPPRWVSNCSTVTLSYCASILSFKSGKTSAIVEFHRNLPSSMNIAVKVAVIDFVHEPIWNWSSIVTGVG